MGKATDKSETDSSGNVSTGAFGSIIVVDKIGIIEFSLNLHMHGLNAITRKKVFAGMKNKFTFMRLFSNYIDNKYPLTRE